jgi:hypothetical protein
MSYNNCFNLAQDFETREEYRPIFLGVQNIVILHHHVVLGLDIYTNYCMDASIANIICHLLKKEEPVRATLPSMEWLIVLISRLMFKMTYT